MADHIDDDDNVEENNQEGVVSEFLNMSDADMANMSIPSLASAPATKVVDDAGQVEETEEEKAATAAAAAALDSDDVDDDGKAGDEDGKSKTDPAPDVVDGAATATGTADKAVVDKDGKPVVNPAKEEVKDQDKGDGKAKSDVEDVKDESGAIDYKAAYERLTAPFKANGRDIQVKSVDDAISLMQMGANYNKKMAALKPSMKLLKMLETNGLMDEAQIGYLIDLHKRDPAAISKLIVDSKIDPLDLSTDKASEYKPGAHQVNDAEMELDAVLDELKDSPTYNRTLQVASTDWDKTSRKEIVNAPQLLRVINDHMQSGVFEIIQAEMESERAFGRLKDLSDLQAYKKVGDAINARGGFNHLNAGSSQQKKETPAAAPVVVTPKPKQVEEDKLKAARRAASGTKAAAPGSTGVPADFNPFAMSDEDFAKFK